MNPAAFWAGVIALVVIIGLVVVDIARTPAAMPGKCTLTMRTILPDICVNSCSSGPDVCTVTTRPYLVFFTQSATCADAVICK